MNSLPDISRTLREAAQASDFTMVALSEQAGLSRPTTRKALEGQDDFRISTLLALAEQLGLDVVLLPKGVSAGIAKTRLAEAYVPSLVDLALSNKAGK